MQWKLYANVAREAGWKTIEWLDWGAMPKADIYHAFDIDKPFYIYPKLREVYRLGLPYILSTIHHPYEWVERFRRLYPPGGVMGKLLYRSIFGRNIASSETVKELFRVMQSRKLSRISFLVPGWKARVKWILSNAAEIWLLSTAEGEQIKKEIGSWGDAPQVRLVPNWVGGISSPGKAFDSATVNRARDAVLVVGRIEARKNCLGVAQIMEEARIKTLFLGRPNPNESRYSAELAKIVERSDYIDWVPGVPREEMQAHYRAARCLLNASYAEVSPMVDIEALASGCAVVTTLYALHHEFLPAFTPKVDPYNPGSIIERVRAVSILSRSLQVIDPEFCQREIIQAYSRQLK